MRLHVRQSRRRGRNASGLLRRDRNIAGSMAEQLPRNERRDSRRPTSPRCDARRSQRPVRNASARRGPVLSIAGSMVRFKAQSPSSRKSRRRVWLRLMRRPLRKRHRRLRLSAFNATQSPRAENVVVARRCRAERSAGNTRDETGRIWLDAVCARRWGDGCGYVCRC